MLRSLRALLLFWTIFASYGWQWLWSRVGGARAERRWSSVHLRNAERLTTGFTRLRGVFIKVGQVLSVMGGFLPPEYGRALERLQDRVPPRPFSEIEGRLRDALGPDVMGRFERFDREPLGAASLAQVHRARCTDGRDLAVKVLYPGIETLIRRDLAVLRSILPVLKRLFPISKLDRVLDQLSAMLARETDYANERSNLERMAKIFADRADVIVPAVVGELSGEGVLTMSFEPGIKLTHTERLADAGIDAERVGQMLVECYFTMLFEYRVFHADPHPGNFLVRTGDDGPELVILDYGAVEEVTDSLARGMQAVVLGALARDDEQILSGLETMGFVAEDGDRELLASVAREYLKVLAEVRIDDFSKVNRETVEQLSGYEQTRGKLRAVMRSVEYPEGYFYVERTLVLLFGLVGQLAPKKGLPGLVMPLAGKAMAMGFSSPPAG